MGKPLGLRLEVVQAAFQRELSVDGSHLLGERRDRAAVEVEAAVGIAARGEEQQRPAACPVRLVFLDLNLLTGH